MIFGKYCSTYEFIFVIKKHELYFLSFIVILTDIHTCTIMDINPFYNGYVLK